ncbi:MBL fold metallo-hydrolase [Trichlorobacter lovleyi]|uniref:MBL fold metallo-hydrolase n=1 Tax=Trichlorobacter lovleyi TaxID=313985 RepID=UPI0023F33215|nr:MBL fold metallo-hydrolase [Trichlorobacter lovleyi]
MIFDTVVVGALGVNCFVLGCEATGQGVVVDPGDEADRILAQVKQRGLTIVAIINTHGHFDHVGANRLLAQATQAPLYIHQADIPMLERVAKTAAIYGLPGENSPQPDRLLEDGMLIEFGTHRLQVIHTPGHTQGGCCLYLEEEGRLIAGDTLFADGVGRTDLPGGSHQQLVESIKNRLFTLPDQVQVYPGHGPTTSIGHEKRHNPYLD